LSAHRLHLLHLLLNDGLNLAADHLDAHRLQLLLNDGVPILDIVRQVAIALQEASSNRRSEASAAKTDVAGVGAVWAAVAGVAERQLGLMGSLGDRDIAAKLQVHRSSNGTLQHLIRRAAVQKLDAALWQLSRRVIAALGVW
jgi:hypothetical protein